MIMATVPTQIRIDEELKKQAMELFGQLGIDISSATNMFLRQCVLRGGLPFNVELPKYKGYGIMTYQLVLTGKFKKGLKRAKKRGLDIELLDTVVDKLIHGLSLDDKHRDHELKGRYTGFRECHIQPDWLLIYLIEHDILTLTLVDTGSHSDLFEM